MVNTRRNGVLLIIVVGGVALVVLTSVARVSPGVAVLLALAVGAGSILVSIRHRDGRRHGAVLGLAHGNDLAYAPASSDYRQHHVADLSLPSNLKDYRFLFSATVLWAPPGGRENEPEAWTSTTAAGAIAQRASTLTLKHDPADSSLACQELALSLSEPFEVAPQRIWVKAADIRLTLPDQDNARLARLAEMRKEEAVWESTRKHEQSVRAYLADDVLKDSGKAVVWWLARYGDGDMRKAADNIGYLTRLSDAANNLGDTSACAADERQKSPADHLASFLNTTDATENSKVLFAYRVARITESQGQHEIAEEIRRRFGLDAEGDAPGSLDDGEGWLDDSDEV